MIISIINEDISGWLGFLIVPEGCTGVPDEAAKLDVAGDVGG